MVPGELDAANLPGIFMPRENSQEVHSIVYAFLFFTKCYVKITKVRKS